MSRLRWAVVAQARSHCSRSASRGKRRSTPKDVRKDNQELLSKPPVAKKKTYTRCIHGVRWDDPYHWMSNVRDPYVREHLELENLYADSVMASTSALQYQLRKEMACRIVGDESSPPERWGPWLYYARIPSDKDYPVYLRRHLTHGHRSWFQKLKSNAAKFLKETQNDFSEQKLLDMNELVKEHGFAHLGVCKVSKDHRLLAYTLDLIGTEVFTLFIKDIDTDVTTVQYRVFKHTLNSKGDDILLYEDKDPQNFVDVSKTKDWQFFTINSNSKTSSEVYLLEAEGSKRDLKLVERRRPGVEYFVEHQHGNLFLLTNAELHKKHRVGSIYRLFLCPVDDLRLENWKQIVLEEHNCIIYDMDIFENYLVLFQRKGGLPQLSVLKLPIHLDMVEKVCPDILPLPKGVCSIAAGLNQDYSSSILRLCVSSPVMPDALLDYNLSSKEYVILQQDKVAVNAVKSSCQQDHDVHELLESKDLKSNASQQVFDLSDIYACEQLRVPSFDMVEVPLTVVYSRSLKVEGKNPAFMTGYGAYGESLDMKWCSDHLSLLDRGWVLAFAHVRGGGELGKAWHDSGRLSRKVNSMRDFLACGEYLVKSGFAHKDWLTAKGVSAGGLLVAATTNMQPDLFRAVILKVPFLDIGNTMLDESLALTVSEYEEWGHPEKKETFDYIQSYTPYDNVKKDTQYPHMLVLSSFLDTRVGYWEAAKWVARLREYNKANVERLVLLKTDMNSGHFTESGRYLHIEGSRCCWDIKIPNQFQWPNAVSEKGALFHAEGQHKGGYSNTHVRMDSFKSLEMLLDHISPWSSCDVDS
ncbi:hypothetical protein GOP47_0018663 [Adiantum capillus-veneris]|uniref:Prolyl endopeptidase n=1 Tax=Adiantum capillus-veneris TaxID=13818 RepID=A0A9D4Z905_ADICA|nr:hypothetical protein GOP47_0018663 [Adiantum capillus-veneris]